MKKNNSIEVNDNAIKVDAKASILIVRWELIKNIFAIIFHTFLLLFYLFFSVQHLIKFYLFRYQLTQKLSVHDI